MKKNKAAFISIACALVTLAIVFYVTKGNAQNRECQYVTVKDGKFYIGDKEYRYVGTNLWYGAILGSEGRGGNRERLVKELDDMKAIGIDNVRVLIGGDGREGIPSLQGRCLYRWRPRCGDQGQGERGQAAACLHGISRALVQIDPDARTALKANGYLTRDSRMVERKKYGQKGARRRFQFSKR